MDYREAIHRLVTQGVVSAAQLTRDEQGRLTALLMAEVGIHWGLAFITDAPAAGDYPRILSEALESDASAIALGEAILDGAICYGLTRISRDLERVASQKVSAVA